MYPCYYIIFDIETGGLITKEKGIPPITEFAAAVVNDKLETIEELDFFVKPYVSVDKYNSQALQVSNITLDLCAKEGLIETDAAKKIIDLFKKAKSASKKPVLCGHNILTFDIPILSKFLSDNGQNIYDYVEQDYAIDTKWWGRIAYPDLSGYTLSDCLMKEGLDNEQAHRAIGDVRANRDLVVKMLQRLRGVGGFANAESSQSFRKNFRFQIARKG